MSRFKSCRARFPSIHSNEKRLDHPTMRWCWGVGWVLDWDHSRMVVLGSGRGRDMTVEDLKEWAVREIVDNIQWQVPCGSLVSDLRGVVFRVQRDGFPTGPLRNSTNGIAQPSK